MLLVATALLAACGSSGRELREPPPGRTAPPRKAAPAGTVPSTVEAPDVFGLATPAWPPGGDIPRQYTCDGEDVSPQLLLFNPPPDAAGLALVVSDLDDDRYHWIVVGIPPLTASFGDGELPPGAIEAPNSFGIRGWSGPCPPPGETHVYEFALYALSEPISITDTAEPEALEATIAAAALETATITGSYERA